MQGSAGIVDRANRRRQVLDQGLQRAEEPRISRHLDCRSRWTAGFPGSDETIYPQAQIQTCIVHLIRNSLANWKDCKGLTAAPSPSTEGIIKKPAEAGLRMRGDERWDLAAFFYERFIIKILWICMT